MSEDPIKMLGDLFFKSQENNLDEFKKLKTENIQQKIDIKELELEVRLLKDGLKLAFDKLDLHSKKIGLSS